MWALEPWGVTGVKTAGLFNFYNKADGKNIVFKVAKVFEMGGKFTILAKSINPKGFNLTAEVLDAEVKGEVDAVDLKVRGNGYEYHYKGPFSKGSVNRYAEPYP